MDTDAGPTQLSDAESWALLREAVVGRLAVVVYDRPEIFPVNYLVDHGTIVFRTAAGTKLDAAVGHAVAFEVDGYEPTTGTAWSVVLKGVAREIKQLYEVIDAAALPLDTWHAAAKPRMVRIEAATVSGRQFVRSDPPPPTSVRRRVAAE